MIVILAEKPSQARSYAEAFQNTQIKKGYIEVNDTRFFKQKACITWGFGHLVSLCLPSHYKAEWARWNLEHLPIVPDKFEFEVPADKQEQFNIVKKLLLDSSGIVVATDSDREGENIARSIIEKAGASNKPIKRLWINSLEVEAIQEGFKNLRSGDEFHAKYQEAKARQIGDWLVGMNASPLYSLLLQKKGIRDTFSIGRVQTPTLYLIFTRQKEIDEFKSEPFFELVADVSAKEGTFSAKCKGRFKTKDEASALLQEKNVLEKDRGIISSLEKKQKETQSPLLHSLSTLQTTANKKWKYSPSDVLKIMQELYEKKLLTYPRTDTNHITEGEFEYLKKNLEGYKEICEVTFENTHLEPRKRYVDSSKVQEHYAIIPTRTIPSEKTMNDMPEKERNIYFEVLFTTLAMFAPTYKYDETKVTVDVKGIHFHATGKVEREKGWKEIFGDDKEKKDSDEVKIPVIEQGETVAVEIDLKEGKTKPPAVYTEGQLINVMKTAGKFVEDEEDKKVLSNVEGIGTEATRANIIETLKKQQYIEVKKNKVSVTNKGIILCQAVEGNLLSKAEMTAKWETFLGQIGDGKKDPEAFLKNIYKFIDVLLEQVPKSLETSEITATLEKATEETYIGKCPICNSGVMDKGKLYGCVAYKETGCTFSVFKTIASKKINESNMKKILQKGKSNLIKGFKGKKNTFDAYVVWDKEQGKTKFEFQKKKS